MSASITPNNPLSSIGAVILDLDGTMIDSVPDLTIALNNMLTDLTLPAINAEQVWSLVGRGTQALITDVLQIHLNEKQVKAKLSIALTSFYKHYRAINGKHSTVYPGVKEGLQWFKDNNIRLACVTNKPSVFTEPLLAMANLYHYFDTIYCSDSFLLKKPEPYPMQMVCKKFGLAPNQVVAIGDSKNDAFAAQKAGCHLFLVSYGYNNNIALETLRPNAIISSIFDVRQLIRGHQ